MQTRRRRILAHLRRRSTQRRRSSSIGPTTPRRNSSRFPSSCAARRAATPRNSRASAAWPASRWRRSTMPKPITAAETPRLRFVIVTLDNHLASATDRARKSLQRDIPELDLSFHAAADWNDPKAIARCVKDISTADIIVVTMMFMEEHAQAILPAIKARREICDAVVCCMSAPEIVKLTRVGRFDMDGEKGGALALLKKLRGGKKPSETGGARQLAMLRRIPRI